MTQDTFCLLWNRDRRGVMFSLGKNCMYGEFQWRGVGRISVGVSTYKVVPQLRVRSNEILTLFYCLPFVRCYEDTLVFFSAAENCERQIEQQNTRVGTHSKDTMLSSSSSFVVIREWNVYSYDFSQADCLHVTLEIVRHQLMRTQREIVRKLGMTFIAGFAGDLFTCCVRYLLRWCHNGKSGSSCRDTGALTPNADWVKYCFKFSRKFLKTTLFLPKVCSRRNAPIYANRSIL